MSKLFPICKAQCTILILAGLFLAALPAFASVPTTITQQGRLLTTDGQPMKGPKTLLFEFYDQATDGELVWSDQIDVDLGDSGFYTAILGAQSNPLDHTVFQDGQAFMQLVIDGKPLLPRLELTSVPYAQIAAMALQARTADHADTAGRASSVAPGSIDTDAIADFAVTADKLASIPWDKIIDRPNIPTYTGSDFVTSNQSCTTAGQMVTGISASGTLVCATPTDNDTKYTAGNGLTLSGTAFSIRTGGVTDQNIVDMSWTKVTGKPEITGFTSSNFAKSSQNCATAGHFISGFSATGTVVCSKPIDNDTKYTATGGLSMSGTSITVAPAGVTSSHLADGSITSTKIAPAAVTSSHLADGSITSTKIAPAAVTSSHLADGSITSTKIAQGSIQTGHITNGAITSTKVAQGSIQTGHITNGAITSTKVAQGSIQTGHIASGSITADKINSPVVLYQIIATNCVGKLNGITVEPSCMPDQSELNTCWCGGNGTTPPLNQYPRISCSGGCTCHPINMAPLPCEHTKIGVLIPSTNP